MSEGIEHFRVTTTRTLTDDGDDVIGLEYDPDATSVVDLVGTLTMAIDTILHPPGD